jgi:hypothetical protein
MMTVPIRLSHAVGAVALLAASMFSPLATNAAPLEPSASDAYATDTSSPSLLDQEQQALAIEAEARALGAIGFYNDASANNTLVVVIPPDLDGRFSLATAAAASFPVRIETRSIDGTALARASLHLQALWETGLLRGTTYISYFDVRTGKLEVRSAIDPTAMAAAIGPDAQFVDFLKSNPKRESRVADYPPFWGGAETLRSGDTRYTCTTGFTVKNSNNTRYMVLAGHCSDGIPGVTFSSPGSGEYQGTLNLRAAYPTYDMERLYRAPGTTQAYDPFIYVSGSLGAQMAVEGSGDPATARPIYCHSGAATFEKCNEEVTCLGGTDCGPPGCGSQCDGKICDSSGCTYNLMVFTNGDGATAGGDSGAPFYLKSSGVAYIRGMVVGGDGTSVNLGHHWSTIGTQLGVSIVID